MEYAHCMQEYASEHVVSVEYALNMPGFPRRNLTDPEVLAEVKHVYDAKHKSCSKFVRANLQRNSREQSNGETAFEFFVEAIKDDSLILLDEPENSLSAKWQMELVKYIRGAVRASAVSLSLPRTHLFCSLFPVQGFTTSTLSL